MIPIERAKEARLRNELRRYELLLHIAISSVSCSS